MSGKVLAYSGDGEGKTSAALGHVLRALGHEKRCLVIFFMKGRQTGETKILRRIVGVLSVLAGSPEFDFKNKGVKNKHFHKTQVALNLVKNSLKAKHYDLIVLDEIFNCLKYGLVSEKELIGLLKNRGSSHVILTGRNLPKSFEKHCDLISIIKNKKHYFDKDRKTYAVLEC